MPRTLRSIASLASAVVAAFLSATAPAQITTANTFTYQGRLAQDGAPFTGTADVRVQLYRSNQAVGAAINFFGVQVTDGLFTIPIDLGPEVAGLIDFIGSPPAYVPAAIELSVRAPAGAGSYTTLSPRQQLNPAPSALGLVNFSRTGTSEINASQGTDTQVFQINANVVQTVIPTRNGDVESVDLKLVNTGAPTPLTLTLRSNSTIFGTSTVTVPTGTNIVTFPFPVGTSISTVSALRLDFNTTNTLGVRYALLDPYTPGSANFLPAADLFFILRLRGEGSWLSPLSLAISSADTTPFIVSSLNPLGSSIRLNASATGGLPWFLTATASSSSDGPGRLRIMPGFASAPAGLTLDSSGNVGINKLTPAATLHVGGNLAVDGTIAVASTTRQYNVAAAACTTLGSTGTYTLNASGSMQGAVAGQNLTLTAPINLPQGAVITKLRYSTIDNATENITVSLLALNINSSLTTPLRSATTSGALNIQLVTTLDVVPLPAPVDNANNVYIIRAQWTCPTTPSNIQIRSLGVEYTVTSPLP